ncbi:MAG: murein biosynthesis integral membrane protein MurJ [Candidatus Aminicenantes bacterium]|nr:murein biosynthesis integral membrane protein MurJ [Candidatus Aminicenantes bacterium]
MNEVEPGDTSPAAQHKRSSANILNKFFVSASGTGISRILGAVRDIVIAHYFGAGKTIDAFWMAWTVPSLFRRFVADEGLTGAMIPAIAQEESKFGTLAARELTDKIFTILLIALSVFCIAGILAAPLLVRLFAYGFISDPVKFNLTVNLTRWLFPFIAMVSLVSYCEGILNHRGHFFIPKIAPGLVSAGIIVAVVLFMNRFSPPVYSLAAGVLAGGIFHFLVQLPILGKLWYFPRPNFQFNSPRVRFFLGEMGKVILIGIFAQLNVVVLRQLASFLPAGSVTHYWNANRIMDLTHGIIAIGMGSALMPVVTRSVFEKDWHKVRDQLEYSIKMVAFFLFPACAFMLFFHKATVAILFRHGSFTIHDSLVTAATLQLLIPFLINLAGINIIKKVYFAIDDRNTLMAVGGFGVALTAMIGIVLTKAMGLGVRGLAVSLSISTFIQLILYFYILRRKIPEVVQPAGMLLSLLRIAGACIPAMILLYLLADTGNWEKGPGELKNLLIFGCSALLTLLTYLVSAYLLKVKELRIFLKRFKKFKK